MGKHQLVMPKMGESVAEATITSWLKKVGEAIEMDEPVLEIATDKVDSEVPSPVQGKLAEVRFNEGDVVKVGEVIAVIDTQGGDNGAGTTTASADSAPKTEKAATPAPAAPVATASAAPAAPQISVGQDSSNGGALGTKTADGRFLSPLVRSIAQEENISPGELDQLQGHGKDGRITKQDILEYLENRSGKAPAAATPKATAPSASAFAEPVKGPEVSVGSGDAIEEMDRMRRLISDHMVMSKRVSPHVTSFVEADVTNLVNWREKIKKEFEKKEGEKITFTPLFVEAVCKAIKDFPGVNVSVDGYKIIKRSGIHIGMAAALPSGNLIVPVIRNADRLNLIGLTKSVNDLANRARNNKLLPDEIQGGTFTLTNVGTFGNVMGTPIINQPQVAILATGAIVKKPAVVETEYGDVIAIRQKMFLSLSYDHRVVDGALGGSFLRRVADYLEAFDPNRII